MLSYTEAEKILENDPKSLFHRISQKQHMILPPKYIGNMKTGIIEQLSAGLKSYSDELNGILIAFSNVRPLDTHAKLIDEQPFLHFNVIGDFIVFQPVIGCVLRGTVNKVSDEHIGCIVHGFINVSIPKPRNASVNGWQGSEVKTGEEVVFEVTNIFNNNNVLSLRGKLTKVKRKKQKGKNQSLDSEVSSLDLLTTHTDQLDNGLNSPDKKRKKISLDTSSNIMTDEDLSQQTSVQADSSLEVLNTSEAEMMPIGNVSETSQQMEDSLKSTSKHKKKKRKGKHEKLPGDKTRLIELSDNNLYVENATTAAGSSETVSKSTLKKKKKKRKRERSSGYDDNNNISGHIDGECSTSLSSSHVEGRDSFSEKVEKPQDSSMSEPKKKKKMTINTLQIKGDDSLGERSVSDSTSSKKKKKTKKREIL